MKVNPEIQQKVKDNMGLVGKVIKDKVHSLNSSGFYSYEDLYQIGCVGLCKAAATDKGGCFSTYAYRLIWNEICDALISETRKIQCEELPEDYHLFSPENTAFENVELKELYTTLKKLKAYAWPSEAKGIDVLIWMSQGYSSSEIGAYMHVAPNLVTSWASKARKFLKSRPEIQAYRLSGAII